MPELDLEKSKNKTLQFYWLPASAFLLLSWAFSRWFNFNGLYGQDSHEYLRYTRELASYLAGGPFPGEFFWPVAYPLTGSLLSFFVPTEYVLQTVSLLSAVVCYVFFGKTLNLLYPAGTQRQRYAFLWLLCSPLFLRAAFIAMPDLFCLALLSTSIFFLVRHDKEGDTNALLIALATGIVVVQIKTSASLLLLPLIPSLFSAIRKRYSYLLVAIAIAILAVTPTFFLKGQWDLTLFSHPWLLEWSPANFFKRSFFTADGEFSYMLPNLLSAFALLIHPGFCFAAFLFLIYSLKVRLSISKWWILSLSIYLLFCAGIPFQNIRFLLPAFPLLLLILYPGFEKLFDLFRDRSLRLLMLSAVLMLQMTLAAIVLSPVYETQQEEMSIARELQKMPNVTIYTFGIDAALRTYQVPQEVNNMWNYTSPMIEEGSMLLYNPGRFNKLYSDTPPVRIYETLRKQNRLSVLRMFPNGWELYQVN